jgi:hypothetical protein
MQSVPFDQRLQLALFDKATGEIVEPDRLTMLVQRFHGFTSRSPSNMP